MNKQRFLSFILVCSMLLSLTACGQRGDSSTEGESSLPDSSVGEEEIPDETVGEEPLSPFGLGYYRGVGINPYYCDNSQNQTLVGLVYESLFELDEQFQAHPCLAESVSAEVKKTETVQTPDEDEEEAPDEEDSEAGSDEAQEEDPDADSADSKEDEQGQQAKTVVGYETDITIKLRDDVTFSDGSSMDADDVVYSLEQAKAKDSVYYSRLSVVTALSRGGSNTVYLTIKGANTNVAALLDIPIVKEGTGEDLFPVGTGPYVPERNKSGLPVQLTADTGWWQLGREYEEAQDSNSAGDSSDSGELSIQSVAQPVENIKIYAADDSDELIFGFSSGNVSMVSSDLTDPDALSYTGRYVVTDYATTSLIYLGCNTAKGVCKKQALRSAIYQSLNREKLVSRMLAGHGQAAALPVSPSSPLYDQELAGELSYDLTNATELCGKADPGSTLTLVVNANSSFKEAMAREIALQLESAGLSVEVEVLSWGTFQTALKKGEYDLYLGEVKLNGNFDLTRLIDSGGSLNYSGYQNGDLSQSSREFNCSSSEERAEAATAFYTLLAEQAPIIPVAFKNYSVLSKEGYLIDQSPTQQNLFYHFWDWKFTPEVLEVS